MTFIQSNKNPDSPTWLLNLPSQTLARLHCGALPDGGHLVTVDADQPPSDEVFGSFARAVESVIPGGSARLAMCTRRSGTEVPDHLVLCDVCAGDVVIHYPALGVTAGIRADGSKIPPVWSHLHRFTRTQRSLILKEAANTLMQTLARQVRGHRDA